MMRLRSLSREEILAPYALIPLSVMTWLVDLEITGLAWAFAAGYIFARTTEE